MGHKLKLYDCSRGKGFRSLLSVDCSSSSSDKVKVPSLDPEASQLIDYWLSEAFFDWLFGQPIYFWLTNWDFFPDWLSSGCFEVKVNDQMVFSKLKLGGFPDTEELITMISEVAKGADPYPMEKIQQSSCSIL
ncbi:hypothetical protein CAPTEDRAFT_229309 [Capitella teleta]|uniref:Uncharacterized protein n=1 Tax=Capitella teleta TaxID=283909 RepID=R7VJB4_CAPTE|nr:hypothetical protein CAPTEDRAFT_229309 [Capitella teleta]|eukprot:ELU18729.1 hypothetical protein CAPTEDRAFT_229309 [Capitella teleta]